MSINYNQVRKEEEVRFGKRISMAERRRLVRKNASVDGWDTVIIYVVFIMALIKSVLIISS